MTDTPHNRNDDLTPTQLAMLTYTGELTKAILDHTRDHAPFPLTADDISISALAAAMLIERELDVTEGMETYRYHAALSATTFIGILPAASREEERVVTLGVDKKGMN